MLAVLPHLERAEVERRVARPRYAGLSPEQVIGIFLDDPQGISDLDADRDPMVPAGMVPAGASTDVDEQLSADLKAATLARAEEDEHALKEWLPISSDDAATSAAQHILLQHYAAYGDALFARDKAARSRPEREQLRNLLAAHGAWSDDQIEGWGAMLARSEKKRDLLAAASSALPRNLNHDTQAAPRERSWGPDKLKGGRVPRPPSDSCLLYTSPSPRDRGG